MKTAILLCGMPGYLEFSLNEIINKILSPLDADLYIYFWYTSEPVYRLNDKERIYEKNFVEDTVLKMCKPKLFTMENYQDKKHVFEEFSSLKYINNARVIIASIPNYFAHWYLNKEANLLFNKYILENRLKYDLIIKMRTELKFDTEIDKNNLLGIDKYILIPFGYGDGGNWIPYVRGITDMMAFGKKEFIDIYMNMYDFIPQYIRETKIVHSETHILQHLKRNGLMIKRFQFPGSIWKEDIGFPYKWPNNDWTPGPEYTGDDIYDKQQNS